MKGMKEFQARMKSDAAFAAKFAGITDENEAFKLAKAEGYDLQLLSDEELDQVAGGTWDEYDELRKLLPKVERSVQGGGKVVTKKYYMEENEVEIWLSKNLGIDADLSTGKWNPFWDGNPNTYKKGDVSLSHTDVIQMIKDYRGIK